MKSQTLLDDLLRELKSLSTEAEKHATTLWADLNARWPDLEAQVRGVEKDAQEGFDELRAELEGLIDKLKAALARAS